MNFEEATRSRIGIVSALVVTGWLVLDGHPTAAPLSAILDHCAFLGPEGKSRVELYLELEADGLAASDTLGAALFRLDVTVTDASGRREPIGRSWHRGVPLSDKHRPRGMVADLFKMDIPPGEYELEAMVEDEIGQGSWNWHGPLVVPDFDRPGLRLSGIRLARTAWPAETEALAGSPFTRGGHFLEPNPSGVISSGATRLRIYYEIYGTTPGGVVALAVSAEDSAGVLGASRSRRFRSPVESVARVDSLEWVSRSLHEGKYVINVEARDEATGRVFAVSRSFRVAAGEVPMAVDSSSLKRYRAEMAWVAEPGELDAFAHLEPDAQLGFVNNFWARRDPTPLTGRNEFAESHRARTTELGGDQSVAYAIAGPAMERLYVLFGRPDRVEDRGETVAWYYEALGPEPFVFGALDVAGVRPLADSGRPMFEDVTAEAGLDFHHVNGASGRFYYPEINTGGVCVFDVDGDGWMDVYLVNGKSLPGYGILRTESAPAARNALYRNLGTGQFEDVTEGSGAGDTGYGMGCAAADFDNDGDVDLYVTNFGPNVLLSNNDDGTFTDVTAGAGVGDSGWGSGCGFADVDGDGFLDLYVANYLEYRLGDEADARTRFATDDLPASLKGFRTYADPLEFPPAPNRFYRNHADGRFVEMAAELGIASADGRDLGVVFADADGDGDPDLFVATDEGANRFYRNETETAAIRFEDSALASGVAYDGSGDVQATMGVAFADFDNDGWLDLATSSYQDEPYAFYRNQGDGYFLEEAAAAGLASSTRPMMGWGIVPLDYDNDGWLDLFVANGHVHDHIAILDPRTSAAQRNQLFRNRADGRFLDVSRVSGPGLDLFRQSRGAARIDYDNDGDPDLLILDKASLAPESPAAGVSLLRNIGRNSGSQNNSLTIRLKGLRGHTNSDGIGARVTVWSAGLRQIREVHAGSSYQSQDDPRIHVGLGTRTAADSLIVRWPSGAVQRLVDVQANRFLTIEEPTEESK